MSLHTWLAFALVALAVSLVPGPAVISVVSTALRGGMRASLATNAGVLVGDAVFVAAAAAGLGALLIASHTVFVAVRWLGIAYLAYLAFARCSIAGPATPSTLAAAIRGPSGSA